MLPITTACQKTHDVMRKFFVQIDQVSGIKSIAYAFGGVFPVPLQKLFPSGGFFGLHILWAALFVALFFFEIITR